MTPGDLRWPVVFTARTAIFYAPAEDFGHAYFGGPLEQQFTGASFGPAPLHRVFTFSPAGLPQPEGHNLQGSMSLFYGMRYSGCYLRYQVAVMPGAGAQFIRDHAQASEILELSPQESSDDWPYRGYPELLPYFPLSEVERKAMELAAFEEQCTWQGLEGLADDELIVVVPASPRLGVSMWGSDGDREAVQLIFRYSYSAKEIRATNQCT